MKYGSTVLMIVFILCGTILSGCNSEKQQVDTKVEKEKKEKEEKEKKVTKEDQFEEVPVQASITANDPMEIDLKHKIDPGTVTPESVYVMDEENAKVDSKLKIDGTKLIIESKDKEKKQGTYTVFVTSKVRKADGSEIGKPLKVVFNVKESQKQNTTEQTEKKNESEPQGNVQKEVVQVKDFTSYNGKWTDSDDYCGNGIFVILQFSEKNVAKVHLGAQMHGQKSRDCANARPDGAKGGAIVTFDNNGVGTFTFTNLRSNVLQEGTIQLAGNKVLLTTKILAPGENGSETYFGDNVTTNLKYHRDK
ncbi:Ig-like domain-containing protein [Bacillus arachidis]|uniref:Ig-like domain-containing protein n=1 Tax=Bacillus arachidis TaxID=2819290 RepID=UPI00255C296C|nr:Ig-like domain-containing protein [Bacillus arachidis]WIY62036.1 Ig-like domain-containing protein [Bacillus arachidis]